MVKCITIGASVESIYAIRLAKSKGIYVYAIDGNEKAEGLQFADESAIVDITNVSQVLSYCQDKEIDFVLPVPIGRYLTTQGFINDRLHLKGPSSIAITNCVDKLSFHKMLKKSGLRNNFCSDLMTFNESDQYNFPLIAKPRFGSGSVGIHFINNSSDLKFILDLVEDKENYIIEEVFPGDEFGVDAQIIDGVFDVVLVRRKENTPPPHCQALSYESLTKEEFDYDVLEKHLRKTVLCLGVDNSLMHFDIIVNNGMVNVIEMSPRPSGHFLHNKFTIHTTDFDMVNEFIEMQCGNSYLKPKKSPKKFFLNFFNLPKGEVLEVRTPDMRKFVEYHCKIALGDKIGEITKGSDAMNRGFYIVDDMYSKEEIKKEVDSYFNIN